MWAAHESCFLFILAAEIFLRSRLDKRGILWYNISIMGSLRSFVAASLGCCCCLDPISYSCLLLLPVPYWYPGWVRSHVKFVPLIFWSGKKLICCCLRGGNTNRPIFAAAPLLLMGPTSRPDGAAAARGRRRGRKWHRNQTEDEKRTWQIGRGVVK